MKCFISDYSVTNVKKKIMLTLLSENDSAKFHKHGTCTLYTHMRAYMYVTQQKHGTQTKQASK